MTGRQMTGLLMVALLGCSQPIEQPGIDTDTDTDTDADTDTDEEDTDTDEEDTDTGEEDTDTGEEDTDTGDGEPKDSQPCGDALWAWAWAGEKAENVHLINMNGYLVISRINDLSGNDNHFLGASLNPPPFQVGYSWEGYSTPLPVISLDKWADGKQSYGSVTRNPRRINATGPFYLAFAGMNTRKTGARELWGSREEHFIRVDQDRNRVEMVLAGQSALLTSKQALKKGPLLLEVWRDEADEIFVVANGVDVSQSVHLSGTFEMTGTGYDGTGSSQWDDVSFEYIACKGPMTESSRNQVRELLNERWKLY